MAEQLPVAVIAELLGVPARRPAAAAAVVQRDREDVRVRADGGGRGRRRAGRRRVRRLPARAGRPSAAAHLGEDLLSHLVTVRDADGDRLTEDELVTTCILLLNAGHEATVNVSGNGLLALLEHPDQLQRLRDGPRPAAHRDRGADALRLAAAAVRAHRHRGRRDRRGHRASAGRRSPPCSARPTATRPSFADPETLDVGRTDNPHISFGAGIHFCIGAPLARVELQASFGALLARTSRLELAPAAAAPSGVRDPRAAPTCPSSSRR